MSKFSYFQNFLHIGHRWVTDASQMSHEIGYIWVTDGFRMGHGVHYVTGTAWNSTKKPGTRPTTCLTSEYVDTNISPSLFNVCNTLAGQISRLFNFYSYVFFEKMRISLKKKSESPIKDIVLTISKLVSLSF